MFGLTFSKILFTILIVIAVWKGFALVSRLARERQQPRRCGASPGSRRPPPPRSARSSWSSAGAAAPMSIRAKAAAASGSRRS